MSGLERYLTALWRGERTALLDRLVLTLLLLPSVVYGATMSLRWWLYRSGILPSHRLPRPVISVGNITVGGTGKTPVTAHIARLLLARGLKVAVLSRGYGGALEGRCAVVSDGTRLLLTPEECGDEPWLLASSVPGLAVVIGSDRYRAGVLAMERLAPDIFLLDDGYQHLRLQRDMNILLMDCSRPLGNRRTLPAGPLREPVAACRRADLVIYTRCRQGGIPAWQPEAATAFCTAGYRLGPFLRLDVRQVLTPADLAGLRCVAFAGIAQPESFFEGLRQAGVVLCATLPFADHQPYRGEQVQRLERFAAQHGADCLLTTEKDGVKLAAVGETLRAKLVVVRLELVFEDDEALQQGLHAVTRQA